MKHALMGAVLLAMLVGCGGKPAPQPAESKAGGDAPAPAGAPVESTKKKEIAVIPKGLAHQFWLTVKAGADAGGAEFGYDILWQGPAKETEVAKQISIVQDMISRKVAAIVMAACDANALVPTIQQALDANIPVITIDSGVNSELPLSFVATDNIAGAKAAADTLAGLIGGTGKVGLIPFVPGAATSELREDGFEEGLKAHPNVTLVSKQYCQSDVAKAMSITQDMMIANPDLGGIFAANEAAAIGAAQAIRAAGKTGQVKLVAFDAAEEEIAGLKEGVIQALIVQSPFNMGYLGVKAAHDAINSKPVEKRIDTGVTVVTQQNFDTPEVQKLLNPLK
jgi:ribose transport system substrate-binding protein